MYLLYYDILQYQDATLKLIEKNFDVKNLPDPNHDTDEVLKSVEVAMAPLGFEFDRGKIDRCPNLKMIASSTLSVPHIDVEYANSRGIKVCYLGDQNELLKTITPTAELAWGLVIAVTRKIPWAHRAVCNGEWNGRFFGSQTPRMLSAMTLGIVGLGRLGSLVASYGKAFGMKVYYYSPSSRNSAYERCQTLEELARCSDIVSVHAQHKPETEGLINNKFMVAMKPGSFIINTSKGELIDENALLNSLESGHLGGASLDVLAGEYEQNFKSKLNKNPLVKYARTHDNLILTPHYGGATVDAWIKTESRTIDLILEAVNY
jgi:D-3-phosphoglycerate dehydrogenase